MAGQGFYDLARERAEALEIKKTRDEEAARIVPVYAVVGTPLSALRFSRG